MYQCQQPVGPVGACYQSTVRDEARKNCENGCPAEYCKKCPPSEVVCQTGVNCFGTTVTNPGTQTPNNPGTRYGTAKCVPPQCPLPLGPGFGSIDLSRLKPGNFSDFLSLLSCVFSYLLYFAIPIAVLIYVLAGVMFLTSQGEPEKITTAKKIVLWNTIGFSVVLLAKGILSTILVFFGSSAIQVSCKFFS